MPHLEFYPFAILKSFNEFHLEVKWKVETIIALCGMDEIFKNLSEPLTMETMPYIVRFKFSGGVEAVSRLEDNPELERLSEKSPFKSEAERWGDEIYFELPIKLNLSGERREMEVGEVAYWPPGNALCLFFGPTPVSKGDKPVAYSPVKPLGRITEGLENLRKVKDGEDVEVEIRKE